MPVEYSDWSALLGFYSEADARSILLGHGVELSKEKTSALLGQIREARAWISTVKGRLGVSPRVDEIPAPHQAYLHDVQNAGVIDDVMKTGVQSWSFGLVELARVHVHQPYINLEYAAKLIEKAPEPDDFGALLRYCLPVGRGPSNQSTSVTFNPAQNTYSVVSENLDLQVVGNTQGEDALGRKFAGFAYGFGLPQMFVVQYRGLFILKNGYHRAYSLLKKGHEAIPCIILKTDDFALTGANRIGLFPAEIILSDKSPIMSDFLTKAAVIIPRLRAKAVLTVHAHAEIVQL